MAFKTFDHLVYFKLEATEGERSNPGADSNYIETTDPTFSVTNQNFERNPTRMSISPVPGTVPGTQSTAGAGASNPSATMEVSFSVELSGSGTAATAPRWGGLLKACGMRQVESLYAATIGTTTNGGTSDPAAFFNYENFSCQASSPYASGTRSGRVIGDTFYDDGTLYYIKDSAGTAVSTGASEEVSGEKSGTSALTTGAGVASGVAWVPLTGDELGGGNSSSLTMNFVLNGDGDYIQVVGCRGTVEFVFTAGDRVLMNFTFTGRFYTYGEGATFTPVAEGRPLPPAFVGVDLAIGESTYGSGDATSNTGSIFDSMSVGLNNDVVMRADVSTTGATGVGFTAASITGRAPTLTFNPDAVRNTAQVDFWDRFLSGETSHMKMTVGTVTGNQFLFKIPAAQFSGITDGSRDSVVVWDSTTNLTGGDYGSSIQDITGATSRQLSPRLGTDNEFVFYQI